MLHIHNGDSSANILKESGLAGNHLPFREALMAGPTPAGLSPDEWREARARFLSTDYELDVEECQKSLEQNDEALGRLRDHKEVVLWFEHDLFCQINLIYLLNRISKQERGETRFSLVCINEFPGIEDFRGLGQLAPDEMRSLFDSRLEITDSQFELGQRAWRAYCSPTPQAIQSLLDQDSSALPFLHEAMLRHLARFPSTHNGLGYVENRALQLIGEGYANFKNLFPMFGKTDSAYGLGDAQFWNDLKRMNACREPLITIKGVDDLKKAFAGNRYHDAAFELTEAGEAVLSGKGDFIESNGIDQWLGGAHLTLRNLWRWDEQSQKLVDV